MERKVVVCGSKGVGKTSFINFLCNGAFFSEYKTTQFIKTYKYENLSIVDCPRINQDILERCYSVIVLFNPYEPDSFLIAVHIANTIRKFDKAITIALCGNNIVVKGKFPLKDENIISRLDYPYYKISLQNKNSLHDLIKFVS